MHGARNHEWSREILGFYHCFRGQHRGEPVQRERHTEKVQAGGGAKSRFCDPYRGRTYFLLTTSTNEKKIVATRTSCTFSVHRNFVQVTFSGKESGQLHLGSDMHDVFVVVIQ